MTQFSNWQMSSLRGFGWDNENEVTTNQSPTISDLGERYLYTPATATDRTLTLPSVGEDEDGNWLTITNASEYVIQVDAADSDTIGWPQLVVASIEMLSNSQVVLRYDHSQTKWEIALKRGPGQVRPTGTVLYWRPEFLTKTDTSDQIFIPDQAERHLVLGTSGWGWGTTPKFRPVCPVFAAVTSHYLYCESTTDDWDVFGSTGNDCTVCGWVYCDLAAGSDEYFITHHEDINNRWELIRQADGKLRLYLRSGGSIEINAAGGTISQSTWHHVAAIKIGAESGIYIDGTQVAYDATFTPDTFTGALEFGRYGGGSNYFDGRMDDWAICYQNIFGAAPNVGNTDTIDVDTNNPLKLVM
jgi:hypothetical protein